MSVVLGLKIDVCTYDGLRVGVPNLLRLLDRHALRASFFSALGPDTSGRALLRVLRSGFLRKMLRTRAVRTYGLRTLVSGSLLPPRHMGRGLTSVLRDVVRAGHELAVHGYDHRRWQDQVDRMDERSVREEIGRAIATYRDVVGIAPRGFGAPGWQCSPTSLRVVDEVGFAYASDTRGTHPFFPQVNGKGSLTLQLPTTLPTLDEALGLDARDADAFVDLIRRDARGKTWSVLTLHAEMEGVAYFALAGKLLEGLRADGLPCVPLEVMAQRVRLQGVDRIPVTQVVPRAIRGRAGTVAMPAGLEVG